MAIRRRYRPRWSSVLYVVVTAFLGMGAVRGQQTLLPFMFGVAISALIVSGVIGGTMMMGVRVRRLSVGSAQVGEPLRIRYELRTTARWLPSYALRVSERSWLPGRSGVAFAERVPPHARVRVVGVRTPEARGVRTLDAVELTSGFPFGLFHKTVTFDQPARVLVRPRVHILRPGVLERLSGRIGQLERRSQRSRTGEEFFALREYSPGDSPRHLAWRQTARLGEPVVREHTERSTRRSRVVLWIDPSATGPVVERTIEVAASSLSALARQGRGVRLEIPQARVRIDAMGSGAGAFLARALDALAMIDVEQLRIAPIAPSTDATLLVRTNSGVVEAPEGAMVLTDASLDDLVVERGPMRSERAA